MKYLKTNFENLISGPKKKKRKKNEWRNWGIPQCSQPAERPCDTFTN